MRMRPRTPTVFSISTTFTMLLTITLTALITDVHHAFRLTSITHPSFTTRTPTNLLLSSFSPPPPLIPEENPNLDPHAKSHAGVYYNDVLAGIHNLYPPTDLERRNALSRTDGYWPFIQKGEDPPLQLTYGEFDFYFFAQLLDKARALLKTFNQHANKLPEVFCDVGSGTGRLVLAAAALHPDLGECRGVELLPTIHEAAQEKLQACTIIEENGNTSLPKRGLSSSNDNQQSNLPMAPVTLICGSFDDPYIYLGDVDIVFCFAACMGNGPLPALAENIGRQCKPGTIVITTEFMLPLTGHVNGVENDSRIAGDGSFELELVERIEGWCWLTGGASTAFVHRVTKSLWQPDQKPIRPSSGGCSRGRSCQRN
ncbi:hypothetical protein MPSEU_000995200 [Mayamaea pseudoterrestris]|nr:hypothetical protein MPSEU_000995200 [Mayamaea pseudoterrestris]